jgi:biopolymer transport protein ExbD
VSGRTLLLIHRKGIISTIPQTWKEGCGVREDDTNIVILIIVVEVIIIIFILCILSSSLSVPVSPKSTSPSEPHVDPSVACTIL